jgi:hypothetical protein
LVRGWQEKERKGPILTPTGLLTAIKEKTDNIPIMQKIDVVDFKRVSNDFKDLALQNIEVIYEK